MLLSSLPFYVILLLLEASNAFLFSKPRHRGGKKLLTKFTEVDDLSLRSANCVTDFVVSHLKECGQGEQPIFIIKPWQRLSQTEDIIVQVFNKKSIKMNIFAAGADFTKIDTQQRSESYIVWILSGPEDIKPSVVEKLGGIGLNIQVIYSNPNIDKFTASKFENQVRSIFWTFKSKFNMKIVLLVQRRFEMREFAWQMYQRIDDNCDSRHLNIEIIEECKFNRSGGSTKRYRTMFKGQKCSLKVAIGKITPYTFYDQRRGFYKGIEVRLIETIAEAMMMKVNYSVASSLNEEAAVKMSRVKWDKYVISDIFSSCEFCRKLVKFSI